MDAALVEGVKFVKKGGSGYWRAAPGLHTSAAIDILDSAALELGFDSVKEYLDMSAKDPAEIKRRIQKLLEEKEQEKNL